MKIYDVPSFPNPYRVRIALAEKNAIDKITFIPVNVMEGEHRNPQYLAKNPAGAVPILELDDGTCITECSAITEYIDHHFDGNSLTGVGAKQRAVISMMSRRAEFMVLDAMTGYFHHATAGLGPDIETYQNEDWGLKQKQTALKGLIYFNDVLAASDFVTGVDFTMADITLFTGLIFADFANIHIPDECVHLEAWRARVASRPSIA